MRAILTDLGVAACLIKNEAILLVKEASGPQKGRWGMPKGTVDEGELPSFAAMRELAIAALSDVDKEMIDYTEERGQEYFLYL